MANMENMRRLTIGSSEYHSALESLSSTEHLQGESSGSGAIPLSLTSSTYCSARIQSMIENRNAFRTELDFDIQYSKDHWTQLDSALESEDDVEYSLEADQEYFEKLKQHAHWGDFFQDFDDLVVGRKIGEGAQAEIYEAQILHNGKKSGYYDLVVKVMKKGYALRSLRKQWPLGMLNFAHSSCDLQKNPSSISGRTLKGSLTWIKGGTLLKDERLKGQFAFVMDRWWGDLRKLIDLRMQRKNHQGPPFNNDQVLGLMRDIAWDMESLHSGSYSMILHRDLKASNVLIFSVDVHASDQKIFNALVIDYECSVGVIGTKFWRAPEILQQLKDRTFGSNLNFTSKADVYSYGMTCYEIVTGHIPFEDLPSDNYDYILSGHRPTLPNDIDPLVREIITRCWHHDPLQRPSFKTIHALLRQAINGRHQNHILWEPRRMTQNEKKSEQQMRECELEREEWERKWEGFVRKRHRMEWQTELNQWTTLEGRCKHWDEWADLKKSKFEWYSWKGRWEEWEELKEIENRWKDVHKRLKKNNEKLKEWEDWCRKVKKWEELKTVEGQWNYISWFDRPEEQRKKVLEWERWHCDERHWKRENSETLRKWEEWGKREWEECIKKKQKWCKEWEEWTSFVRKCTSFEHKCTLEAQALALL